MRNRLLLVFIPVLLFSCMQKPKPVAQAAGETPVAIQYVGVPTLKIHAAPNDASDVITKYGFGETVSVLGHRGEWAELRMFDNSSGWARTNELMTADDAKKLVSDTPRFYVEPPKVPGGRSHGETRMGPHQLRVRLRLSGAYACDHRGLIDDAAPLPRPHTIGTPLGPNRFPPVAHLFPTGSGSAPDT